jgi:drug/metabolite transporter (DMT)-like permease
MMAPPSRAIAGNAAGIACMLLWATNFPLVASLLLTWQPLLIASARMAIATLTIVIFVLAIGQGRRLLSIPLRDLFRIGGLALSTSIVCIIWAQAYADPVTAAVVISAMPLTSALMGLASGTEKVTWRIGLGLCLAIAGGIMTSIASQQSGAGFDLASSLVGAALLIVGSALYVWHSRALVIKYAHVPDAAKSASVMAMATLTTLGATGVAIGLGLVPPHIDFSPTNLVCIAFLGVFTVGASTVLWFVTGRLVGVTVAAMHHNMVPFYVIVFSGFAGAQITLNHVLGAAFVILGAVVAQRHPGATQGR